MKRDVLLLAGALLAGLVGGAVSTQLFTTGVSGYVQQRLQPEQIIRAERFELVGRDGKTRAVLGERTFDDPPDKGQQPFPGLFWVDEEGKARAVFGVSAIGPILTLSDSKGGSSLLSVGAPGPSFSLNNDKGGSSLLSVFGVLGPSFMLSDGKGGSSSLHVGDPGAILTLRDSKGGSSLLSVGARGSSLSLFGPGIISKADSVTLQADTDGPSLSLDKDGKVRATLGYTELEVKRTGSTEKRAASSLVLFDKDGKVIWQVP